MHLSCTVRARSAVSRCVLRTQWTPATMGGTIPGCTALCWTCVPGIKLHLHTGQPKNFGQQH